MVIFCRCGCGQEIKEKPYHKYYTPKYIPGHNTKGKTHLEIYGQKSEKLKENLRIKNLGKKCSKETLEKLKKKKPTQKQKKQISKTLKRKYKEGIIEVQSTCWKKENIPWNKGKSWKELFDDDKYEEMINNNRKQAINNHGKCMKSDTIPELLLEKTLKELNIKYKKQFKYKLGVADFILPTYLTIIEVDGVYWHNIPKVKERDKKQELFLIKQGYTVLRFSDLEIKNNISHIRETLKMFVPRGSKMKIFTEMEIGFIKKCLIVLFTMQIINFMMIIICYTR